MANVDTVVTATGSYIVGIDEDDDSTTQVFKVRKDGGGPATDLLVLDEGAHLTMCGRIQKGSAVELNTTGAGDIVTFEASGTRQASIGNNGKGMFDNAGIQLEVVTTNPDGARTGAAGDVIVYNNAGTYYLSICQGGTSWRNV